MKGNTPPRGHEQERKKHMSDRNYTDPNQSSVGAIAERVGDMTGKPPSNRAADRDKAAKMANLL